MAVPAGKQKPTQAYFILQARELLLYTLQVTRNKRVFTDKYFDAVTAPIIETAQDIFYNAFEANNIRVSGNDACEKWESRKAKERLAIEKCGRFLAQIDVAQRVFHFKTKRLKYWGTMIINVRNMLQKWHESDKERYGKYSKQEK